MRVAALVLALVLAAGATAPAFADCGGHYEQTAQSKPTDTAGAE